MLTSIRDIRELIPSIKVYEVLHDRCLDKLRMELRNTIDFPTADTSQVRHPHILRRAFLDQAHPRQPIPIAREHLLDLLQEEHVDVEDDLHVAREKMLDKRDRPFLKSLWEYSVVREEESVRHDLPSLIPGYILLIYQNPHQLGDSKRRVRVIKLYRIQLRKLLDRLAKVFETSQHVAERGRAPEILLFETELLADHGIIVRVKHSSDSLSIIGRLDGSLVVASIE